MIKLTATFYTNSGEPYFQMTLPGWSNREQAQHCSIKDFLQWWRLKLELLRQHWRRISLSLSISLKEPSQIWLAEAEIIPHRIGTQCQRSDDEFSRFNREVKPVGLMLIEVIERGFVEQLWAENENLEYLLWRHYPNFEGWEDDPEGVAAYAVGEIGKRIAPISDLITHIVTDNEFIHDQNHSTPELLDKADRYIAAFIREADNQLGKGVAWGNFNCGHYDETFVDLFARALEESVKNKRSFPTFHAYDWDKLDRIHLEGLAAGDGGYWLCGRHRRIMGPVREKYPGLGCAVTELGIDYGVIVHGDHRGFRQTRDDLDEAVDLFCGDHGLSWYYNDMPDYVKFALIFLCGSYEDWERLGFEIGGTAVIARVAALTAAPPEPEPPVNGGDMDVKIYDFNTSPSPDAPTRDWEWLQSVFGDILIHPITELVTPVVGELAYQLAWIDCKTGEVSMIIHVDDYEGNPKSGVHTVFYYSTAELLENQGFPPDANSWTSRGAVGTTNESGDTGPGMSEDSYYSPDKGEVGPHQAWIYDAPSELVSGIGMLTAHPDVEGNHLHVNLGYKAVKWEGEEPPPSDEVAETLRAIADDQEALAHEQELLAKLVRGIADDIGNRPQKITLTWADGSTTDYLL